MTTHLFKIKKRGEDGELQDFEFNIPANESEMEISESLTNPELTFKVHCEFIKGKGGQYIALTDDEGRWNKCDLFKIKDLNPGVKTKIEGDYYLWLSVAQLGGGKRKKSKRRKPKKRRSKRRKTKRRS